MISVDKKPLRKDDSFRETPTDEYDHITRFKTDFMPVFSDRELVVKAVDGDLQAFDVLMERYVNPLMNYVYNFTHNYSLSYDVVQETFLHFLRKLKKYRDRDNIRVPLFSIAGSLMKQRFRHSSRRSRTDALCGNVNRIDTRVLSDEFLAVSVTHMALDFLLPGDREAVILRDIEGLSYQDISLITDEPVKKIKNRVSDARLRLCEYLY